MKVLLSYLTLALISVMLTSCFSSGPEATVKKAYAALDKCDMEEFYSYCTDQMKSIATLGSMGTLQANEAGNSACLMANKTISVSKTELIDEKENVALVKVWHESGKIERVKLVKVDGDWKMAPNK